MSPHCHSILSRDVNAAKNILDEALRATGSMVLCLGATSMTSNLLYSNKIEYVSAVLNN